MPIVIISISLHKARAHKPRQANLARAPARVDTVQVEWIAHLSFPLYFPLPLSRSIVRVRCFLLIIFEKPLPQASIYILAAKCVLAFIHGRKNTYRHLAPVMPFLPTEINRSERQRAP